MPALLATASGPVLQAALAAEGLAIAFATGEAVPCFSEILAAEAEAARLKRGFWGKRASCAPRRNRWPRASAALPSLKAGF
jgi:endonuclease YncB( thermonuclease family)